jgi:hypothetical protein
MNFVPKSLSCALICDSLQWQIMHCWLLMQQQVLFIYKANRL